MANVTTCKFGIGLAPKGEDRKKILRVMHETHNLANRLISVERARRQVIRDIQAAHPVLGPLAAQWNRLTGLKDEISETVIEEFADRYATVNAKIAAALKARAPLGTLIQDRKELKRARALVIKTRTQHISGLLKEVGGQLKEARELYKDELVVKYREVEEEAKEHRAAAAKAQNEQEAAEYGFDKHPDSHSGTKWSEVANQNDSSSKRMGNMGRDNDPDFRRFQSAYVNQEINSGYLDAGINQKRKTLAGPLSSFNTNKKGVLYIPSPPSTHAYDPTLPRGARRKLQRCDVGFRIGSMFTPNPITGTNGKPIPEWVTFRDVHMHREIPATALIIDAKVTFERIGTREKWFLILTLEMAEEKAAISPATTGAAVIRQTTKVMDGYLRYAECVCDPEAAIILQAQLKKRDVKSAMSSPGVVELLLPLDPRSRRRSISTFGLERERQMSRHSELTPEAFVRISAVRRDANGALRRMVDDEFVRGSDTVLDVYRKKDELSTIISKHFEQHIPLVRAYIKNSDVLPKCLQEAKERDVHLWGSPKKFQILYRAWAADRIAGDEEAFETMKRWAYQDLHLYQWMRNIQERTANRKVDVFRKTALALCEVFSSLHIDNRAMTSRVNTNTDEQTKILTMWQKNAGFGTFRLTLRSTAKRVSTRVESVNLVEVSAEEVLASL